MIVLSRAFFCTASGRLVYKVTVNMSGVEVENLVGE